MTKQFFDEERVAFGFRVHEIDQLRWGLAAGAPLEEERRSFLREAAQDDLLCQALAQQRGKDVRNRPARLELVITVGSDDEHRDLRQALRHVLGEQQRRLVRPVQIFEHEHQRGVARGALDELADGAQKVAPLLLGRQRHRIGNVRVPHAQLWHQLSDLRCIFAERLAQRFRRNLSRRVLDVLDRRKVGRSTLLVDAVAG
jgi:hypothetical protein